MLGEANSVFSSPTSEWKLASKVHFQMNKCYHQMVSCHAAPLEETLLLCNGENKTSMSPRSVLYNKFHSFLCHTRLTLAALVVGGALPVPCMVLLSSAT